MRHESVSSANLGAGWLAVRSAPEVMRLCSNPVGHGPVAVGGRAIGMKRYLISFDDGAVTFPEEETPAVGEAAHQVVRAAQEAGVWVFGGGVESQRASIVTTDGMITDGPYRRPRLSSAGSRLSRCPHEKRHWSGPPSSPSPAAALRRSGRSCRPARLIAGDSPGRASLAFGCYRLTAPDVSARPRSRTSPTRR